MSINRIIQGTLAALLFSWLLATSALGQTIHTAATCNQADVNAVINGPTHTAINGDTIIIPPGSCTWTAGINVPTGIGITILGSGQGITTITDDFNGPFALLVYRPTNGNALSRLSALTLLPYSGLIYSRPIVEFAGTCNASGCPNARFDHLTYPSSWSGKGVPGDEPIIVANVFGVADHNIVGDVQGSGNGVALVGVSHAEWQGVGQYGDNSWTQPDTMGTAQAFYIENNTLSHAFLTDTDSADSYNDTGGARLVCRFNTINHVTGAGGCGGHGTESSGRIRGLRQAESYGNTLQCDSSCDSGLGMRSGTGISFGNVFNTPGGWNKYVALASFREEQTDAFGLCIVGPYDVQDGRTTVYSGTITSVGSGTITVSGTPWTAGQFNLSAASQSGIYYFAYDTTAADEIGIVSNTSNTLTYSWKLSTSSYSGTFNGTIAAGHSIVIIGTTIYAAGTHTGSSGAQVLTDSTKSWTTNQWENNGDEYSVLDVTIGHAFPIGSNTANTVTAYASPSPTWTFTTGDEYVILRSSRCLDQPASAGGTLLSGAVPAPGPAPQVRDPLYQWNDNEPGYSPFFGNVYTYTQNLLANRDYYASNPSFTGTAGTGWGKLANRPASCTPSVGYFATDQGSWNQSGNSFGQGELFVCTATNTWSLYYTPYVFPHPLDRPDPPTGLNAVAH